MFAGNFAALSGGWQGRLSSAWRWERSRCTWLWGRVQVTGVFGSSMEVMISVCGETPTQGQVFHCGDAYATVVSVDPHGNPVELPFELAPHTPNDLHRCRAAADRCRPRLCPLSCAAPNCIPCPEGTVLGSRALVWLSSSLPLP